MRAQYWFSWGVGAVNFLPRLMSPRSEGFAGQLRRQGRVRRARTLLAPTFPSPRGVWL